MKRYNLFFSVFLVAALVCGCGGSGGGDGGDDGNDNGNNGNGNGGGGNETPVEPIPYDDTDCVYKTYNGLVVAGYQGWFTTVGAGTVREDWYHYRKDGKFEPGFANVDFWPDVSEYTAHGVPTYETAFPYPEAKGGGFAHVFSSLDYATVDLHFKWMQDYGIDGVFMQRFVGEAKSNHGKEHFNTVLRHALKAAKKYNRAICVMYDLSGSASKNGDMTFMAKDWEELQRDFKLFDNKENPTYLWHNGRPMVTIWGVGFNDGRQYTTADVSAAVDMMKGPQKKCSVMLGLPYYWRTGTNDTESNNSTLMNLIKKCDFIMPWAVGRYNESDYDGKTQIDGDIAWCAANGIDYAPLCFPGFSWRNMTRDPGDLGRRPYEEIPRNKGTFLWKQMYEAKQRGAKTLYIAMFDEIDEGTAIFKCARNEDLPLNGAPPYDRFVGIEDDLLSDHYLWLVGEGARMMRGEIPATPTMPSRP